MKKNSAYRAGLGLALGTTLMLIWLALGVGILGADGDRANAMYAGVLLVGIIGSIATRLRAAGMSLTLVAMAVGQAIVTVIALVVGVQRSGVSPIAEIVGLNGFFIALFLGAAWLFRRAAGQPMRKRGQAGSATGEMQPG